MGCVILAYSFTQEMNKPYFLWTKVGYAHPPVDHNFSSTKPLVFVTMLAYY